MSKRFLWLVLCFPPTESVCFLLFSKMNPRYIENKMFLESDVILSGIITRLE